MKAVLISTRPEWCEKICHEIGTDKNGQPIYEKTIEVRKTRPSIPTPFKVYIYCTKASKKYQTICGCMIINTDELYRLPNGKIKHDWSGELMCCNGEYTRDNFLNGKVIGSFVCDKVYPIKYQGNKYSVADEEASVTNEIARQSCLDYDDMISYLGNKDGYGWHISQLKIYNKPKELKDFLLPCGGKICWGCNLLKVKGAECINRGKRYATRPPQSWCYVQELEELEQ